MRWFKHFTNARRDEKIDKLIADCGPIAYARWWAVLEAIAEQMDESDRCSLTLSWWSWAKITWASNRQQAERNLRALAEHSLCNLVATDKQATCSIPNLLKIRARKKPIGSKTGHTDIEVDIDKDINPPIPPFGGNGQFEQFYKQYPRKKQPLRARKAFEKAIKISPLQEILSGLERAKASPDWQKNNGEFIPYPATWLNAGGWMEGQREKESTEPRRVVDFHNPSIVREVKSEDQH